MMQWKGNSEDEMRARWENWDVTVRCGKYVSTAIVVGLVFWAIWQVTYYAIIGLIIVKAVEAGYQLK